MNNHFALAIFLLLSAGGKSRAGLIQSIISFGVANIVITFSEDCIVSLDGSSWPTWPPIIVDTEVSMSMHISKCDHFYRVSFYLRPLTCSCIQQKMSLEKGQIL